MKPAELRQGNYLQKLAEQHIENPSEFTERWSVELLSLIEVGGCVLCVLLAQPPAENNQASGRFV